MSTFSPWFGKTPWRRTGQPTPVFLPGESHGQRSLEGYSPWGHTELGMTEAACIPPLLAKGRKRGWRKDEKEGRKGQRERGKEAG